MRSFILSVLFTITFFVSFSQELKKYSFEQVDSLMIIEERPVAIFLHTEWCKYCLKMENITFKNDSLTRLLNSKFYFISFDAESRDDVKYSGNVFKFLPKGNEGIHEMAFELGTINGEIKFPTFCILKENNIVFQNGGFMNSNELILVLEKISKEKG